MPDSPPKMKILRNSPAPAARFLARHSAIVALAAFAVVGAAVFDDYAVSIDYEFHRNTGYTSFEYIWGDENALLANSPPDRFYGVAFQVPLIAVERVFGLEDSRERHLSRRLLIHALFLAGGFFTGLLAYRLFGSRLIALLAMLIFLLHPRMYAHSFFNSMDLPFLSALMVSLYLTHRAFRRGSVWAFALCGAGAGLLANIRIMGFMLFPAVLGMLALDAFYAMKRGEGVKHILANICAFSTAFAAGLYAAWPLLWRDPLNLIEAFAVLSRHPTATPTLFRGETVHWPNLPWDYVPTWILITTPPVALLLAALGIVYLARLCAARWRDMFVNSTARFGLLALACLTMPAVSVVALNSSIYNGWRHMYFLYAPLCVLAAFGLRALADIPRPNLRAGALALAALGIAFAGVRMIQIHPYQNDYFNSLVDKSGLGDRWQMDYWHSSHREALETLLAMRPTGHITVTGGFTQIRRSMEIIPEDDRRRLHFNRYFASFRIPNREVEGEEIWRREVYGVPIAFIMDARAKSEAAHSAIYAAARASEPMASAGGFDMSVSADGRRLTYVKEDCGEEDARGRFDLSVFPADPSSLPRAARDAGLEYQPMNFRFREHGAIFDGKCVIVRDLPRFPIDYIETRRYAEDESRLWSASILVGKRYRRALALSSGERPAIRSDFDVHMEDGAIIYLKEGCAERDARGRFFLSIFPADARDLPQTARDAGLEHEPLNFDFRLDGIVFDGKCIAALDLPGYPISRIETGQFIAGEGELWSGEILFEAHYERYRDALAALAGEPAMRSDFDVYMQDGTLIYVKAPCAEGDTRGRFFLSVFPADARDLPQDARDAGLEHEPLNFDFSERGAGAVFDGKCVIIRDLPDYPISRIETGQWTESEGELWSGRAAVGD